MYLAPPTTSWPVYGLNFATYTLSGLLFADATKAFFFQS